ALTSVEQPLPLIFREVPGSSSGNAGHPNVVHGVVAQPAPLLDCDREHMGQYREVGPYGAWSPCLSQGVSPLGKQVWGKVMEGRGAKLFRPPLKLVPLVVARIGTLVG